MVLDKKFSRRQVLRIGAGGAVAVGLAPLGPAAVLAAPPEGEGGRLIPPAKVGTITFTQRDVPGRDRHRRQRGAGCAADNGLARRCQLPRRPHGSRSAGATAGRLERAPRVPRHGRHRADRVRRVWPERRQSRRRGPQPAPGDVQPRGRAAYLAYAPHACEGSSTTTDSRPSATMASSRTPGPGLPAPAAACRRPITTGSRPSSSSRRSSACPSWAPATIPTSANNRNIEPWTAGRREVGGPQHAQPRLGNPPLPAQPRRGLPLPPGRPDGHGHPGPGDRRAHPTDRRSRGVGQAAHAALPRHHRPGPVPARDGHLLGHRRPAPVPLVLRL